MLLDQNFKKNIVKSISSHSFKHLSSSSLYIYNLFMYELKRYFCNVSFPYKKSPNGVRFSFSFVFLRKSLSVTQTFFKLAM